MRERESEISAKVFPLPRFFYFCWLQQILGIFLSESKQALLGSKQISFQIKYLGCSFRSLILARTVLKLIRLLDTPLALPCTVHKTCSLSLCHINGCKWFSFLPETVRQRLAGKKSVVTTPATAIDILAVKVSLKDLVCYLSLLEGGRPEDKLECKLVPITGPKPRSDSARNKN